MNRATASPPASTRPRADVARALGLAVLATAASCSLSQNGVMPPADTFFYPTSGVMSPMDQVGEWLFVANSNADLRFNDGTLVMVNVGPATDVGTLSGAALDRTLPWDNCAQADYVNPLPRSAAPICCRDVLDPNIINCDERRYIQADATVRIGSFAAQMIWQTFCGDAQVVDPCNTGTCQTDPNAGRLLIGVRGDTSLTYVDVAPVGWPTNTAPHPAFHCSSDGPLTSGLGECEQRIQDVGSNLNAFSTDPNVPQIALPDEPYALTLDDTRGFLYVGHLVGNTSTQNSGGVSLFDASGTSLVAAPAFPPGPTFIAPFGSPFQSDNNGFYGITTLQMHEPLGSPPRSGKSLFASSRYVPQATMLAQLGPSACDGADSADDVLIGAGNDLFTGLSGSEIRGVQFIEPSAEQQMSNDLDFAQRAYVVQRLPPALIGFDIAQNASRTTIATPTDITETCSGPTFFYQHDAGDGARLYVNCFDTGELYIFDPNGPVLLTTLMVARGPAGIVFDPTRPVAYVLSFTQNDVVVVDLAPGSPTQYHVVQRLGFPTVSPR